jgi:hypothetical protein
LILLLFSIRLYGDGGVIVGRADWGDLNATVFASPAPLRAGPTDFSVLVQKQGQTELDAKVRLRWTSLGTETEWLPPCCSMKTDLGTVTAKRGHSGNQLLFGTVLAIPTSGPGKLDIEVEHAGEIRHASLELSAGKPPAAPTRYWPWLAITPLAILGFLLHQNITHHRLRPKNRGASSMRSP